jgi:hypothetical protein
MAEKAQVRRGRRRFHANTAAGRKGSVVSAQNLLGSMLAEDNLRESQQIERTSQQKRMQTRIRGLRAAGGIAASTGGEEKSAVRVTQDPKRMEDCEAMLIYLNGATWTRGSATDAFAEEIAAAMREGLPLTLAHEMPGVGGQEVRQGITFAAFFASDATPVALIKVEIYDLLLTTYLSPLPSYYYLLTHYCSRRTSTTHHYLLPTTSCFLLPTSYFRLPPTSYFLRTYH